MYPYGRKQRSKEPLDESERGESKSWLKTQHLATYFGHLMRRTDSVEKTLMLGKIEGLRRRGQQRMRWLDGITASMYMTLSTEMIILAFRLTSNSRAIMILLLSTFQFYILLHLQPILVL